MKKLTFIAILITLFSIIGCKKEVEQTINYPINLSTTIYIAPGNFTPIGKVYVEQTDQNHFKTWVVLFLNYEHLKVDYRIKVTGFPDHTYTFIKAPHNVVYNGLISYPNININSTRIKLKQNVVESVEVLNVWQ